MGIIYKVLGQINPTANTVTTLYTVPSTANTIISTISVCNQTNVSTSFDLAVIPSGDTLGAKNYINYNTPLPASDTITLTLGLTLAGGDVIKANVRTSTISVNAFGSEIV